MPLRLKVDSGGEYLLPFAKKKLRELKDEMKRLGVNFRNKWIQVNDSERIFMQSQAVLGIYLDYILITAGGGWVFYVRQTAPEPQLYVAEIAKPPALVAANQGVLASSRAKGAAGSDRAYLVSPGTSGFDIVLPDRKVQPLRPALFLTGQTILGISAGPTGAAVLARDAGTSWLFGDLGEKNITVAYSGTAVFALFSTLDNKFFFQRLNTEVYGLDGETADFTIDPLGTDPNINLRVNAAPVGSGYDVFGLKAWDSTDPTFTYNFTALEMVSGRTGVSSGVITVGEPGVSPNMLVSETILVTNKLNAYGFGTTVDGSTQYVLRQKLTGSLDEEGNLSYSSSSGVTITDIFRNDGLFWGGAATLTEGYAFLITTPDGLTTDVSVINSSGAVSLLEGGIIDHAEFVGRVSAASPTHAWLATFYSDSGTGDTGLKIYNETGLKATFPDITNQTLLNAGLVFAGYAGEVAYFRLKISATEYRMVGSDGSAVDPATAWPSGFILTSIGGHVWASKAGEVNWLTAGATLEPVLPSGFTVLPHVTHITQASAVHPYPISTQGSPTLVVPEPASCYPHQIFAL